jgi:hypothetical protein
VVSWARAAVTRTVPEPTALGTATSSGLLL